MAQAEEWVLLAYRLPRVPSTPRSAVWRKLKRLGVAWLGDGLVALPADARTREHLEWVAGKSPSTAAKPPCGRAARSAPPPPVRWRADDRRGRRRIRGGRRRCGRGSTADPAAQRRAVARLRRELHRIQARDFFACPQGEAARRAVEHLAAADTAGART